jgi:hypothetical protein
MVELLKNPVSFGVFAGLITYFYLVWNKRNEIERAKKSKKNKKVNKKVDILVPAIVAIVVWFVSYLYFNKDSSTNTNINNQVNNQVNNQLNDVVDISNQVNQPSGRTYKLVTDSSSNLDNKLSNQLSYTLITNNKGITLPDGLHANMFIEKL